MIGLALRFPAGRFHATPWGRHVNEAAPEWPPSPWRLLRALVATWKRKLPDDPRCGRDVVESLLSSLAEVPLFALPPAATGHTRHYMPWFKKGPDDRTMVFDAFVALDKRDEVFVLWPDVRLSDPHRLALELIADNLGALGRAESWVEARVLADQEATERQATVNCVPALGAPRMNEAEPVRVLTADPITAFSNEHTPKLVRTEGTGKKKQKFEDPFYSPDWHLCMETLALHEKRWSDPPGSAWVTYLRPRDCFAVAPRRSRSTANRPVLNVARFILDSPVLPLVKDTLRVAESTRLVAMGCYRRAEERRLYGGARPSGAPLPRSAMLSGKDEIGEPLTGHGHALYLPTDEDGDGFVDHVTIIAEAGFGPAEMRALDRMRALKRESGDPVNLLLVALGRHDAVAAPKLLGPSVAWVSATPFVATRHAKSRGKKKDKNELLGAGGQREFARHVLMEELARLRQRRPDLPEPVSVEPLNDEHRCGARGLRPIQFQRFRRKQGDDGGRRACGAFRIVFPVEVTGPICLGHSSHFGLGLFVPE